MNFVSNQTEDDSREAPEQPRRAGHDGVEHRLHVRGRASDHSQDVGGSRLLLERLGQIGVSRLELLEQAHVLDGDHRLVREGLEQSDLSVSERIGLEPVVGRAEGRAG